MLIPAKSCPRLNVGGGGGEHAIFASIAGKARQLLRVQLGYTYTVFQVHAELKKCSRSIEHQGGSGRRREREKSFSNERERDLGSIRK